MAADRIIEEDQGIYTRAPHPHNGYFAGDFGDVGRPALPATSTSVSHTHLAPQTSG